MGERHCCIYVSRRGGRADQETASDMRERRLGDGGWFGDGQVMGQYSLQRRFAKGGTVLQYSTGRRHTVQVTRNLKIRIQGGDPIAESNIIRA